MTMSLTSKVKPYKHGFGPFASEVYKLPYPYYYRADERLTQEEVDEQILSYFERFMLEEVASDNIARLFWNRFKEKADLSFRRLRLCEVSELFVISTEL